MESYINTIVALTAKLYGEHSDLHVCVQIKVRGFFIQVVNFHENQCKLVFPGGTAEKLEDAYKATISQLLQEARIRLDSIRSLQSTVDEVLEAQRNFLTKTDRLVFATAKRIQVLTALYNCARPTSMTMDAATAKKLFDPKQKKLDLSEVRGKKLGISVYDLPEQSELLGSTSYDFYNSESIGLCATVVDRAQQDDGKITREMPTNVSKDGNRVDGSDK